MLSRTFASKPFFSGVRCVVHRPIETYQHSTDLTVCFPRNLFAASKGHLIVKIIGMENLLYQFSVLPIFHAVQCIPIIYVKLYCSVKIFQVMHGVQVTLLFGL